MKKVSLASIFIFLAAAVFPLSVVVDGSAGQNASQTSKTDLIQLPNPRYDSGTSVEKALNSRRSVRSYADEPLSLSDISQILWAAQGITKRTDVPPSKWNPKYEWQGGYRTAPSAGALYAMEVYVLAGKVNGLSNGVYKYIPKTHSLKRVFSEDKRTEIYKVALQQSSIKDAAAVLIMAGVYERTSYKYGARAERYVHMEAGFVGENVCLQAVALGLGTVMIGAFQDEGVKTVLALPKDEFPLAIMPLGKIPKE